MTVFDEIPSDVLDYIRGVFSECNAEVSRKLSGNPAMHEEGLDHTWIDRVAMHSAPVQLPSQWFVRLETHFLGGGRHFGNWEVADIGVLILVRTPTGTQQKVALLQSKRLYPTAGDVRIQTMSDFYSGLSRLADPEDLILPIGGVRRYEFSTASRYQQITAGSDQVCAIDDYAAGPGLKTYYQLYNPWSVPYAIDIPALGYTPPLGTQALGARIAPASEIHQLLGSGGASHPSLDALRGFAAAPDYGWRLEDFICDEVLRCREGDLFSSVSDERIRRLFYARTGAIAAGISISIQAPAAV